MNGTALASKHAMRDAPPLILIVDDEPLNVDLLVRILRRSHYSLSTAGSGPEALGMLAEGARPDIILLDITMPKMDGFQVCRRLKVDPQTRDIPVIFITARVDAASETRALELGAVDFITKPVSPPRLLARLNTHLALRSAQQRLEQQNTLLTIEKHAAGDGIKKMLGSDRLPSGIDQLSIALDTISGDIALAAQIPSGDRCVLLGDFTGHGLPAAIGGSLVAYIFETLANEDHALPEIAATINRELYKRLPTNVFMAAAFLKIDRAGERIRGWNCGMPPTLCLRGEAIVFRGESDRMALGIDPGMNFQQDSYRFAVRPGDRIFLQTDGVIETEAVSGALFGLQRLESFLGSMRRTGASLASIENVLKDFAGNNGLSDDISLIQIQF